jgi:Fe-S-cluster containining protein
MNQSYNISELSVFYPDDLHFSCVGCGDCCNNNWAVGMENDEYQLIVNSPCYEKLKEYFLGDIIEPGPLEGTFFVSKIDSRCPFLNEENQCLIQGEIGYQAKPVVCRKFPVRIILMGKRVFISVSYMCPSIINNSGTLLSQQLSLAKIEEMINKKAYLNVDIDKIFLSDGIPISVDIYDVIEKIFFKIMAEKRSLNEKLWKFLKIIVELDLKFKDTPSANHDLNEISGIINKLYDNNFEMKEEYVLREIKQSCDYLYHYNLNIFKYLDNLSEYKKFEENHLDYHNNYIEKYKPMWLSIEEEFTRYMKQMVWQKTLLTFNRSIVDGAAFLIIAYRLLVWYTFTSSFISRMDLPDTRNAYLALRIVEGDLKYAIGNFTVKTMEDFAKPLMDFFK